MLAEVAVNASLSSLLHLEVAGEQPTASESCIKDERSLFFPPGASLPAALLLGVGGEDSFPPKLFWGGKK